MTWSEVAIVVTLVLLAVLWRLWVEANRLDRLHIRTHAARAALDGAYARLAVAARVLAATGTLAPTVATDLRRAAEDADPAEPAAPAARAAAELRLSLSVARVGGAERGPLAAEIADAEQRVALARRFYNDAVRDTRALRAVWFTRFFRLAGRAPLPDYAAAPDTGAPAARSPEDRPR